MQELGREAQNALQIPVGRQVPIYILPAAIENGSICAVAVATPSAIYINPELLNCPYGEQRAIIFHEAVHIKYGDNSVLSKGILFSGACLAMILSFSVRHKISPHLSLLLSGISVIASVNANESIDKRNERRADILACTALNCSECVEEFA